MAEKDTTTFATDVIMVGDASIKPTTRSTSTDPEPPVTISCVGATSKIDIYPDIQYWVSDPTISETPPDQTIANTIRWRLEVDGVIVSPLIGLLHEGDPSADPPISADWTYLEDFINDNQDTLGITAELLGMPPNPPYMSIKFKSGNNKRIRLIPDKPYVSYMDITGNPTLSIDSTGVISLCLAAGDSSGISCSGATPDVYLALVVKDATMPDPGTFTMEANGVSYDISQGPESFPSFIRATNVDNFGDFPPAPNSYSYMSVVKLENLDSSEAKRLKFTWINGSSPNGDPYVMGVFLPFIDNPTVSAFVNGMESTVCLAASGDVTPPTDFLRPDFAVLLQDVGGTVTDNNGNVYNGQLRNMNLSGVQSMFMAVINTPATSSSFFDNTRQAVVAGLTEQVLSGDYINVKTVRFTNGVPTVDKESQFTVLGSDILNGYIVLPFDDIFDNSGGGNVAWVVELTVHRGLIGQSTTVTIGSSPEVIMGTTVYTVFGPLYTASLWVGNNWFVRLYQDVEGIGPAAYSYYKFTINPVTFTPSTELAIVDNQMQADPVQAGFNRLLGSPNLLYKFTGNTINTVSYDIYDIALDITIPVVFSTAQNYFTNLSPTLFGSTDGNVLTLQHPATLTGDALIGSVLQRSGNTYQTVTVGNADLTNVPGMNAAGLYRNTNLFQNPIQWGGMWNRDGSRLLAVIPTGGTQNSDLSGVVQQNTPIIYDLTGRYSTGKHTVTVSPSQTSFINTLIKYGIYNRYYDNSINYDFNMLSNGRYIMATPTVSNGGDIPQASFLFYETAGVWDLHTIFIPNGVEVPDSISGYYDPIQVQRYLGGNLLWETSVSLGDESVSNDDEYLIYHPTDGKLYFVEDGKPTLRLKALRLGTDTWFDMNFVTWGSTA